MRIALFGSNSAIAQSLIPVISNGNEVMTLGRSNADIIVDLNAISAEFELPKKLDTLVLCSAHFGGSGLDDYLSALNVNVLGTLKLFDLAIKAHVKHFIFISSIYGHFEAKSSHSTIYSVTKKTAEEVLIQFSKGKRIKLTIIRPSQIIGDYDSNKVHQPFFYSLLSKIKNSEDVWFYGSHNPKRNFINIVDLCSILHRVILLKLEGVYDCVFPQNTSFLEIANHAKSIYKSRSIIAFDKTKPDIPDNTFDYDFQLYDLINYTPKMTVFEGIEKLSL
jgi:nucleoside-diphosphate-sugar epimerase